MDVKQITEDYHQYSKEYEKFQEEIAIFIHKILEGHKNAIDIDEVRQRPNNQIKTIRSILDNCSRSEKYQKKKSLFEITDIAGVRITCCCEDDYSQLDQILYSGLISQFDNVIRETKPNEGSSADNNPPYRAIHFTFSKKIESNGKKIDIFGEVQLRTVMGNAWAILNRKYVYKIFEEGEPTELTSGASAIMEGCEKIWSVIKSHKLNKEKGITISPDVIKTETRRVINTISTPFSKPTEWLREHKSEAQKGIVKSSIPGFMEIEMIPSQNPPREYSKNELLEFARKSQIHTFGWPIGVYLDKEDASPIIDSDGIHAELSTNDFEQEYGEKEKVYDYWALHLSGSFYTKTNLFEDTRGKNKIFFNTRIVRITEVLMYAQNLYKQMGFPDNLRLQLSITYGGLTDRILSSTGNRLMFHNYKYRSNKPDYSTSNMITIKEINSDIVSVVDKYATPFFEMFGGFELSREILKDIVLNYVAGKVT